MMRKKKKERQKGKKRKKEAKRKEFVEERKKKEFVEREGKRKGKEREKEKREDFSVLRRSKLDSSSTKVGTRSAIYVWTPKTRVSTNSIR